MITRIKHYECNGKPSEEDLIDTIIVARNEKCAVYLQWVDEHYGYLWIRVDQNTSLTTCKQLVKEAVKNSKGVMRA